MHRAFSILGGPRSRGTLVAFTALVLLRRGKWRSSALLITSTAGMGGINTTIKKLVRRRRPSRLPGRRQASGYSFPSGHSSGSVVFFGTLGYLAWHLTRHRILTVAACAAGGITTLLIGQSRVSLREHHGSDVLAGFGLGLGWLILMLRVFAHLLEREQTK